MKKWLLVAVLALAACGPSLTGGKVVTERDNPAHDETYTTYTSIYCGKHCYISIPVTHTVFVPESWELEIQGNCGQGGDESKCDTAWVTVDQQTYNAARNGDLAWYGPTPTPQ